MELSQIQQYAHKIVKIIINNENTVSNYSYVTIKIHLDRDTNETVRFSLTKNPKPKEWIAHQNVDNDFFIRIPNTLSDITEIYAHYFPASLYDYTSSEEVCSVYDFTDFEKDKAYNQWDGMQYPLQIKSYGYEMLVGDDNKPLVRSLLTNSVSQYKDPNYKNYVTTSNPKDTTEKGRFPLSSRYRNSLYNKAPDILGQTTQLPYWESQTPETSGNSDCDRRTNQKPYWEAKIYRSGLSPLINHDKNNPINVYLNYQYLPTSTEYHQHYFGFEEANLKKQNGDPVTEEMITAVESYVPYKNGVRYDEATTNRLKEQLATYCQKIKDGIYTQTTTNKSYEVLNGDGLIDINQAFDTDATYRIIRHGAPFDSTNIMFIDQKNVYDINLDKIKIVENCLWEKNQCQNYWSYIPTGEGQAYLNVSLKANTHYVLKYFIYIPGDAYVEDDSCYMEVQSQVNDNITTIGELPQAFKNQDKKLRHQWVYHEIPFYTLETNNRIIIKGPQHNHEGTIGINKLTNQAITNLTEEDRNNPDIEVHDCKNDIIHFYSIQIAEMVEYSPVLKYTDDGLYVTEGSKFAHKTLEDVDNEECTNNVTATNTWQDDNTLHPTSTWINRGTTELPIPATDIYIHFDSDFDIIYNNLTTELSYTKGDYPFTFDNFNEKFDETLSWVSNDDIIQLDYDKVTTPYNTAQNDQQAENRTEADLDVSNLLLGELRLFNEQRKYFTTGINNDFTLKIEDAYGNPVTVGEVECSIWKNNKEDTTPCSDSEKCLGIQKPDANGTIKFQHLNFKNFKPGHNTYYLRVVYKNNCYNKEIIKWKPLHFLPEYRNIYVYTNKCDNQVCYNDTPQCCTLVGSSVFDDTEEEYVNASYMHTVKHVDEYPLRLDVKIIDQLNNIKNEGYCELSVNDKVIQTTFVDRDGMADFYLDEFDLDAGMQTVKIEYYLNPNEAVNFTYFIIHCDTTQGYDERPAIPIRINKITNETVTQLTTQIYEIAKDDIFFVDIDCEDSTNFSITIKRNNTTEVINVYDKLAEENRVIAAMYNTNSHLSGDKDKYTITTGNLKNKDGSDASSLYRTSKKEFTLLWKDS